MTESAIIIEYLDSMIVLVSNDNMVLKRYMN